MISYIILEDEPSALRRLKRKMRQLRPNWLCNGEAADISSGRELIINTTFDLILSDIELADGNCFELFNLVNNKSPIIFVTAFDQFAIKAFEFNSIHYLLKPISDVLLESALKKFEKSPTQKMQNFEYFQESKEALTQKIISRVGHKSTIININDIAYIRHSNRITKAFLFNSKSHLIEQSLEALTNYLPSNQFFRINRQIIINREIILQFSNASSHRLKLKTNIKSDLEFIVSKEKNQTFKKWLV